MTIIKKKVDNIKLKMESEQTIENVVCEKQIKSLISANSNALASNGFFTNQRRALVQASLSTVFDKQRRHLSGTLCLTGDTMEGIVQLLVFLKAFSVSFSFFIFERW